MVTVGLTSESETYFTSILQISRGRCYHLIIVNNWKPSYLRKCVHFHNLAQELKMIRNRNWIVFIYVGMHLLMNFREVTEFKSGGRFLEGGWYCFTCPRTGGLIFFTLGEGDQDFFSCLVRRAYSVFATHFSNQKVDLKKSHFYAFWEDFRMLGGFNFSNWKFIEWCGHLNFGLYKRRSLGPLWRKFCNFPWFPCPRSEKKCPPILDFQLKNITKQKLYWKIIATANLNTTPTDPASEYSPWK